MASIIKTKDECGDDVEKRERLCIVGENVSWCSHYGIHYRESSKNKTKLLHDPAIPLLGIYLMEMKKLTGKDICTSIFTAAFFSIPKTRKQLKCPLMDECINKM